jgi:hypothetical protein
LSDEFSSPVANSELMAVLESMNDTVDWKFVTKNCVAVLKGRWVFKAGAATFAVRGLFAALWAAVYWQWR